MWVHQTAKSIIANTQGNLVANLIVEKYPYPSVNIVGKINGTDPKLKSEYLLYSGHQDAHGIRNAINNDSTFYGADDNGECSTTNLRIPVSLPTMHQHAAVSMETVNEEEEEGDDIAIYE